MTRHETSFLLGKVMAYLACGKDDKAREWAKVLIEELQKI